jgi:prophage antirepressor-like protein
MEANIQIFKNSQFGEVRVTEIDGKPYFAGKDVATILDYVDTDQAIRQHVDNEDKILMQLSDIQDPVKTTSIPPHMQGSKIVMITESGVYALIFGSTLPKAKEFKRWVTSEVLPSIRKTGGYTVKPLSPIEILQHSVNMLVEQEKRLLSVENRVNDMFEQHSEATRQLKLLPVSDVPVKEMPLKGKIRLLVNKYCSANMMKQEFVYNSIYSNLEYIYGIRLKSCKKSEKESYLDVAGRRGCLNEIYNIVSDMVKTRCEHSIEELITQ